MFDLFAFLSINFMGMISPGPDFAIVTHYGLKGSRRSALLAALGITSALLIHVLYCVLGVAWFLQNSPLLFCFLQLLGAGYLGYLGLRLILSSGGQFITTGLQQKKNQAFISGFFTNLLNPKATLFLLSLFSQFITPETSLGMKILFAASIPIFALGWFSLLSILITHPSFLPYLQRYQVRFSRIMGCMLILLGLSVVGSVIRSLYS